MAKGHSKKRQGAASAKVGGAEMAKKAKSAPDQPLPHSPPPLNIMAYPHILQSIIGFSSTETLAVLIRCSKTIVPLVSPALYRNLRLTDEQLTKLIDAGRGSTRRGAVPRGRLSFSPQLHAGLASTQSIHLLGYDSRAAIPTMPPGSLTKVPCLVIAPVFTKATPRVGLFTFTKPLLIGLSAYNLSPFDAAHLFLRISDHPLDTGVYNLDTSFRNPKAKPITFISSFAPHVAQMPICEVTDCTYTPAELELTTVFLPPGMHSSSGWSEMFAKNPNFPHRTRPGSTSLPTTIVGTEYFATSATDSSKSFSSVMKDAAARDIYGQGSRPITCMSFVDWLDAQQPGAIFTLEEEAALRKADRAELDRLAAQGKVH